MKHMKSILAMLLALVMVFALSITAYADGDTYTITLTPNAADTTTHTYAAYQIFKGDLAEKEGKKILSNIQWGDSIDSTKLGALASAVNALRSSTPEFTPDLTAASSANDFADAIAKLNLADDSEKAIQLADAFAAALNSTAVGTVSGNTISDLPAGYYLVKDVSHTPDSGEMGAVSRYMLQVLDDVTKSVKSEVPQVDKKIVDGTNRLSANSASIGDEIPFEIKSKVPDMTGYNEYYFVLNDTMSKGLTFNNDVAITIGTKTLVKDNDFTVTASTSGDNTTVKIVLKDFIQYNTDAFKGKDIVVTYTATLNEKADLTATGNENEVQLTFSNDPNYNYDGSKDEPSGSDPTGETPESTTKTFSTQVELTKVDASDTTKTLKGAKFSISGEKVNVTLINNEVYQPASDGTYYRLKDGTYTETAPTTGTEAKYDSTTQKYKKVTAVTKDVTKESVTAEGYVNESGVLTFKGLGAGTYTITELIAPDGYNKLQNPITLVITGTLDQTAKTCAWSATVDGEDATIDSNTIKLQVKNNSGTQLPSTGGMGTTLFYVLGGLMMAGAGVVLVSRKRMGADC